MRDRREDLAHLDLMLCGLAAMLQASGFNGVAFATVDTQPVNGGIAFAVTGEGPVTDSVRRMVMAHATTMNGVNGWQYAATETPGGAIMTVIVPAQDQEKLNALGFFGVLTVGMHHQEHHLMIARGQHPHS